MNAIQDPIEVWSLANGYCEWRRIVNSLRRLYTSQWVNDHLIHPLDYVQTVNLQLTTHACEAFLGMVFEHENPNWNRYGYNPYIPSLRNRNFILVEFE